MNKDVITKLCSHLYEKRISSGMTQRQFATTCKIPLRTLQRIESGEHGHLRNCTLKRIELALQQLKLPLR